MFESLGFWKENIFKKFTKKPLTTTLNNKLPQFVWQEMDALTALIIDFCDSIIEKEIVVTYPKEILQNVNVAVAFDQRDRVETSFGVGIVVEAGADGLLIVECEYGVAFIPDCQVKRKVKQVFFECYLL